MANDNDKGKIKAEAGGDLTVGRDIVGGDKITKTTNISEGGPVARYAVIGMAVIAVVAVIGILIAVLWGGQSVAPTATQASTSALTFTSASSTAIPTNLPTTPPAATSTTMPTPVEATATASPSATSAPAYFRSSCIVAEKWDAYPFVPKNDPCLPLSDVGFIPQDNGLVINYSNPATTCPQDQCDLQKGIHFPLEAGMVITLTLEISETGDFYSPNSRTNLTFAVVDISQGSPYKKGVYLFYYATQTKDDLSLTAKVSSYGINFGNCSSVPVLIIPRPQPIVFSLQNNGELAINVGNKKCSHFLNPDDWVFYIGYDLYEASNLTAIVSDFSVQTK